MEHLKVDCYAGTTFHVDNHVKADITTGFVSLHGGKFVIKQSNAPQIGKPIPFPPPALTVDNLKIQNSPQQNKNLFLSEVDTLNLDQGLTIDSVQASHLIDEIKQLRSDIKAAFDSRKCESDDQACENDDQKSVSHDDQKCNTIHVLKSATVLPNEVHEIKLPYFSFS